MATISLRASAGANLEQVVEANPGAAIVSKTVELNIDQSSVVTDSGTTRPIQKREVVLILDLFMQYLLRETDWPEN